MRLHELAKAASGARSPRGAKGLLTLMALLAAAPAARGATQEAVSGARADYVIRARLDGDAKRIAGTETVLWTNGSRDAVGELRFHLYLNAFSNNRSTHLAEAKGKLRDHAVVDGWGWTRIGAARLVGRDGAAPVDLLPTLSYRAPDDGNEEDRTVFELALPAPVPPGGSVEVELEWTSQLPRVRRRTGFKGDFLLVAQWFPKLGVYEEESGWNCHQFHSNSEFYADYGTYDVTLDLPAEYAGGEGGVPVGTSGRIVSSTLKGEDRVIVRALAPDLEDRRRVDRAGRQALVHDFAWTADPDFVVHTETFRYSDWAQDFAPEVELVRRALGPDREIDLRNVDVRLLIHPERADQAERHVRATQAALFFYGLWFGEYPYGQVTVVDPAWGARAAGGMEYPTLFTCGTRLFTTPDMQSPESVTVHECGHQFWYGLVGNNEFESAWLDEGFNSFADSEVMYRVWGERRITTELAGIPVDGERLVPPPGGGALGDALVGKRIPVPFTDVQLEPFRASGFLAWWRDLPGLHFAARTEDPRWGDRRRYVQSPDADPLMTAAWEHVDRLSYSANSYQRTALVLRTLRGLVGEEAFVRGMRHYAETWRYRHPRPEDFFASFEEGAGAGAGSLAWFWETCFASTATGDWSVQVDQRREREPRGYFADPETGEYVLVGDKASADEDDGDEDRTGRSWTAEITLRRRGDLRLPIEVELVYANGEREELVWSREAQAEKAWLRHVVRGPRKLASVRLDPREKVWLDLDTSNDRWFDERDEVAPTRWAERALSQAARYLQWLSRFGG